MYAFELSVRTSFIDADHGYLNGGSVFVYPAPNKSLNNILTVQPAPNWGQVSTALRPLPGSAAFTYQVRDYDELVDSPIEIGNQKILRFIAINILHEVAMSGTY